MLLLVSSAEVRPQWSADPRENNPICTEPQDQIAPQLSPDGTGGSIYVWLDRRNSNLYQIYAQRFDSLGHAVWTSQGIPVCQRDGTQRQVEVISDGSGGAIVTWQSFRDGIYAQRITAEGVALWETDGTLISPTLAQNPFPKAVPDGQGGAIITWADNRSGNYRIYAQRIDADGDLLWNVSGLPNGELVSVSATDGCQYPRIVANEKGGAVIVWTTENDNEIYAQTIDSTGQIRWFPPGVKVFDGAGDLSTSSLPMVLPDGESGIYVAWSDYRNNDYDVYAQRIRHDGIDMWTDNGVAVCNEPGIQRDVDVTSDSAGGAIVVWHDLRINARGVYARRVNKFGLFAWNTIPVCTLPASNAHSPSIASDMEGGAIIAWVDSRNPATQEDIYAQRLHKTDGHTVWQSGGVIISSADRKQSVPKLTSNGRGGAIIVWEDNR
ncbi:MAG: hypothetical protein CL946_12285, partial [Ectothiorhodospiraceae bacterium]|nr:hypothetical protein [Ectothiorhodospiraceae bacterium]